MSLPVQPRAVGALTSSRISRGRSCQVRAQSQVKGALWSLRKAINQRRRVDPEGGPTPLCSVDFPEDLASTTSSRMTLGTISVEGGPNKRKAGAQDEPEADYGCARASGVMARRSAAPSK